MTAELPVEVRAAVERIEVGPAPSPADPATGALGRLASWWTALGPESGGRLAPTTIGAPPVDGHATGSSEDSVRRLLVAGITAADRAVDAGATLLVVAPEPAGNADVDDADRAVIAVLTRREASAVLPQPAGMTDRTWMARCEHVRELTAAAHGHRGDPVTLIGATGADAVAFTAGVLVAAAARRTPCLLDGTRALAAAVLADRIAYRARGWWLVASDSPDPARTAVVDRVDLTVALPLGLSDETGLGARAVLALLTQLSG